MNGTKANERRKGPEFGVRVSVDGETLTNLRFADDCILLAQSRSDAQKMLRRFMEISAEYGLQVHPSKTKLISWTQWSHGCQHLQIGTSSFAILSEYESERYLGRKFCLHKCQATELHHRISAAWAKFQSFKQELTGKNCSVKSRLRLFEAVVSSTVLHGSCTWALTRHMAETLDIARRKMLRHVLRIFRRRTGETNLEEWSEYMKRSARVIEDHDAWYNLVAWSLQARARKWKFAGALVRSNDQRWSKLVLDWVPAHGKRNVGRPLTRWVDGIEKYAGGEWKLLAASHEDWGAYRSSFVSNIFS